MKFTTIYRNKDLPYRLRKNKVSEDLVVFDLYLWITDLMYKFFVGPFLVIFLTLFGFLWGDALTLFLISLIPAIPLTLFAWFGITAGPTSIPLSYFMSTNKIINWQNQSIIMEGGVKYELIFDEQMSNLSVTKDEEIYILFPEFWIPVEHHDLWKILMRELDLIYNSSLKID